MRKHRVFAGILAAVMLLCMAPSALAADAAQYNGPTPGQKNHNGILLDKTAESLNGNMETRTRWRWSSCSTAPAASTARRT